MKNESYDYLINPTLPQLIAGNIYGNFKKMTRQHILVLDYIIWNEFYPKEEEIQNDVEGDMSLEKMAKICDDLITEGFVVWTDSFGTQNDDGLYYKSTGRGRDFYSSLIKDKLIEPVTHKIHEFTHGQINFNVILNK